MKTSSTSDDPPAVLVVDDDQEIAEILAQFLESECSVETAYSGKEALEAVDEDIDIVLLDRRMGDIHGDQVLREIRNRGLDCRVVMVTAVEPDVDVITMDFDDYLVKPVNKETVLNAVERMVTRNALDRNLLDAFALASKMATLEAKMDPEELENSEEYAKLEAEFDEFRRLIQRIDPNESLYAELSAMKMSALFANE